MPGRSLTVLMTAVALLVATGCTADPSPVGPGGSTTASNGTEPTGAAPVLTACPPTTAPAAADSLLAGITLPCLTGGDPVELARLGRPAVINLWASWCGPCRIELPEFQRVADVAGDELVVLGVVTEDSAAKATALAADLGLTFPSVLDETGQVQGATGVTALPLTLFVGADGNVRHSYAGPVLTSAGLVDLVRTHLGVELG